MCAAGYNIERFVVKHYGEVWAKFIGEDDAMAYADKYLKEGYDVTVVHVLVKAPKAA